MGLSVRREGRYGLSFGQSGSPAAVLVTPDVHKLQSVTTSMSKVCKASENRPAI